MEWAIKLPGWFWCIYIFFLLLAVADGLWSNKHENWPQNWQANKRRKKSSMIAIILSSEHPLLHCILRLVGSAENNICTVSTNHRKCSCLGKNTIIISILWKKNTNSWKKNSKSSLIFHFFFFVQSLNLLLLRYSVHCNFLFSTC